MAFPRLLFPFMAAALTLGGAGFGATPAAAQPAPQPAPQPNALRDHAASVGAVADDGGRLRIPCPPQTESTAVLLVLGQSNAANHAQIRTTSAKGVVNAFGGACYAAQDPLLGATGDGGSLWTTLGDRLIAAGRYDRVVVVSAGINGSDVAKWQPGGSLNGWMRAVAVSVRGLYRITHVLWVQGESDLILRTSQDAYEAAFLAMLDDLRAQRVDAPVYVTVSSGYCGPDIGRKPPPNPVSAAQHALIAREGARGVRPGPDTDEALSDPQDRYDGCHMTAQGVGKAADLWMRALQRK